MPKEPQTNCKIKELPLAERPREKLMERGAKKPERQRALGYFAGFGLEAEKCFAFSRRDFIATSKEKDNWSGF